VAEITAHSPFITSIFEAPYEGFDESILASIKSFCSENQSVQRSNANGYQSPPNLHSLEELSDLFNFITQTADTIIQELGVRNFDHVTINEAWANINKGQNSHNQVHTHTGILSGVFYVQAPEGSGNLNIMNPGMNCLWPGHYKAFSRNQHTAEVAFVKPKEGVLYLWPSYIPHSVDCNSKDVERISVSFNLDVE